MNLINYIQVTLNALGEPSLDSSPEYAEAVASLKLRLCEAGHYDLSLSLPLEATKRKVSAVAQFRRVLEVLNTRPAPVDGSPLTPQQAAERLGVGVETLLGWIHNKQLKAVNVGKGRQRGRYRIQPEDLERFMQFRATKA